MGVFFISLTPFFFRELVAASPNIGNNAVTTPNYGGSVEQFSSHGPNRNRREENKDRTERHSELAKKTIWVEKGSRASLKAAKWSTAPSGCIA